jgi:hypothetical protein
MNEGLFLVVFDQDPDACPGRLMVNSVWKNVLICFSNILKQADLPIPHLWYFLRIIASLPAKNSSIYRP